MLSIYSSRFLVESHYPWTFWIFCFLRGFAEWVFIIGVYGVTRDIISGSYSIIPVLSELSMPFYLTHQQVLVPIASLCSWIPYLSKILRYSTFSNSSTFFRIISCSVVAINIGNIGGIMADNQVRTYQILLWTTWIKRLNSAWKVTSWKYSFYSLNLCVVGIINYSSIHLNIL